MKYFAYGSNLDLVQMTQRCPAAKLVGPAHLANHRICFPRRSPVRGCAVASVEPHKGAIVWGVIYELDDDDLRRLDEREGFDPVNPTAVNRYCRVDVTVHSNPEERIDAVAYVAVPEDDPGHPSEGYMRHIIEGAVAHSFPDDYIEFLRAIVALEDGSDVLMISEEVIAEEFSTEEVIVEEMTLAEEEVVVEIAEYAPAEDRD